MADEATNRDAFLIQARFCDTMAAPIYARLCRAIAVALDRETVVGARVLEWPGEPIRDAVPLRFVGGLNALVRAGSDPALAGVFAGAVGDEDAIVAVLRDTMRRHDATLLPWLDGPPQTNEPGRSAALMAGLLEVAGRHGPKLELLEIGSSAGLNLLIDRFGFDLGGIRVGPRYSPIVLKPRWCGPPPLPIAIDIVSTAGCDIAPLDATDPAVAERLAAYVWPEATERLSRLEAAVAMLREHGVDLARADAADWLGARLAQPQPAGVTRVLMHSVVWQYLPRDSADRISSMMATAADSATPDRPLGWVMLEPDRRLGEQFVRVRSWPGHGAWRTIASAHAHGAWIDTTPRDEATTGDPLPGG